MKQVIIVRKDLNMSLGKTCGQVSHASMAFISNIIRESLELIQNEKSLDSHLKWKHLENDDFVRLFEIVEGCVSATSAEKADAFNILWAIGTEDFYDV